MRSGRGNFFFIILMVLLAVSMMVQMNSDSEEVKSRNFGEMMEILPLAMMMGIPMMLFGSMIYFVMREDGKIANLVTSSLFVAGYVSLATVLFMPVEQDIWIFAMVLIGAGTFIGRRIYKDLKTKNYL